MELQIRDYKHIRVIEDNYVGCGICYTVCPDGVFTITEKKEA